MGALLKRVGVKHLFSEMPQEETYEKNIYINKYTASVIFTNLHI